MTSQRVWAVLLVCLQVGVIAYPSATIVFPLSIVAITVFVESSGRNFSLSASNRFRLMLLFAVIYTVKYLAFPHQFPFDSRFIGTPMAHVIAQFFLTVQVIQICCRTAGSPLPYSLPIWGMLVMVAAYDVNIADNRDRATYLMFALAFAVLTAFYISAGRTAVPRRQKTSNFARETATAMVVLTIAAGAWLVSDSLFRYERDIEALLSRFSDQNNTSTSIAFSGRAKLGSVVAQKSESEDLVALRIIAEREPGYLRGKAFDVLSNSEWRASEAGRSVLPEENPPAALQPTHEQEHVFAIAYGSSAQSSDQFQKMIDVWPHASLEGRIFAPPQATHLKASVAEVRINELATVEADDLPASYPYTLLVASATKWPAPTDAARVKLTALPPELDPRVHTLAAELFADLDTSTEKIAAVLRHFQGGYKYSLNIAVPPGVDPLSWFLLEKPPAHCEYFASGAAALLRLGGVPSRYVTGFYSGEKNEYGDYWIARNRDAHAWVEAYDDALGWVIVEATPATGVPAPEERTQPAQLWEYLRALVEELQTRIRQGGVRWLLQSLWAFVSTPTGWIVLVIAAGLLWLRIWWYRKPRVRDTYSAAHAELRRLLARMDAKIRRRQLVRRAGETLQQFSQRIREAAENDATLQNAAEWYALYGSLRYRRDKGAAAVTELKSRLDAR